MGSELEIYVFEPEEGQGISTVTVNIEHSYDEWTDLDIDFSADVQDALRKIRWVRAVIDRLDD